MLSLAFLLAGACAGGNLAGVPAVNRSCAALAEPQRVCLAVGAVVLDALELPVSDACKTECGSEHYASYLACSFAAAQTSEFAHCSRDYTRLVHACIAERCR